MSAPSTARELVERLGGHWASGSAMARCPAHRDRTPSLSVNEGAGGIILIRCWAGCSQESVIYALRMRGLWAGQPGEPPPNLAAGTEREQDARRKAEFVDRLWRETWRTAAPARGSPIETWIRPARGIPLDPAMLDQMPLRWSTRCPLRQTTAAAMLALMTDAVTGEPRGLHRTFLMPDGSAKAPIDKPRQMLGHAGIIRLSPDEDVTAGLGIAEGIETALAVIATGFRPVWACGSLEALKKFPVLGGIGCLTVFSDAKPHEIAGARSCADRWAAAGREAILRVPRQGDWNDALALKVSA